MVAVIPGQENLLPKELGWFYLAAPWISLPILSRDAFLAGGWTLLQGVLALYVPFVGIPAACHAVYAWMMPRVLRRVPHDRRRLIVHGVAVTAVALAASLVLYHPHAWVCPGGEPPFFAWVLTCVIVTWTFVLPALLVQQLRHHGRYVEQLAQAERQAALEAQLQALQARTNPHFFFNSMNTVASLIPEDPKLAEQTLERLADIFRYALESSKTRFVTLAREVDIIRDYLAIQEARFGTRLRYAIELDPSVKDVPVPPLVLQPLVENAVLHGLGTRSQGVHVRVNITRDARCLVIEVVDDGPGPGASQHSGTGTSMADLRTRLRLVYGAAEHLETRSAPGGGFLARLSLPLAQLS
jgi:two-component system sensor histidine kinase AlgZ